MTRDENCEEFDPEVIEAFESVKGYRYVRGFLMRIAEILRGNPKFKALGSRDPSGIILFGKNGAGKTTLANCLIRASGRPSFQIHHISPLTTNYRQITDVFAAAENQTPSIIFLDDLDQYSTISTYLEIKLKECMDAIEGKNVFIVFTADRYDYYETLIRPGKIDIALDLEAIDQEDIREIVEPILNAENMNTELAPQKIAKILSSPETTPLIVKNIMKQAVLEAASNNHPCITAFDFFLARLSIIKDRQGCSLEEINRQNEKRSLPQEAYETAAKTVVLEVMAPGTVDVAAIYMSSGTTASTILKRREDGEYSAGKEAIYERDIIANAAARMIDIMKFGIVKNEPVVQLEEVYHFLEEISEDGIWFDLGGNENGLDQENNNINIRVLAVIAERIASYLLIKHQRFVDALANMLLQEGIVLDDQIQECRRKSESSTDEKSFFGFNN